MLFAATKSNTVLAATAPALVWGEAAQAVYAGDPQFEYLGPRTLFDNGVVDYFVPSANRNPVSMITAPLFVDTLFRHVERVGSGRRYALQLLGDIPDTPAVQEMGYFEKIVTRRRLLVEGYDRGNHSSSNAFGVVNLLSRSYDWIRRHLFRRKESFLEGELAQAVGGAQYILTPQKTIRGMHRMLHAQHVDPLQLDNINVRVARADDRTSPLAFSRFWRPAVRLGDDRPHYWEALVNYDVADLKSSKRGERVHPFYIQAAEQARFRLPDGSEAPIYSISLDTLDHDHLIAVVPGVSAFQVRLVECFIEEKLRENPHAQFKLSSHFPVTGSSGLFSCYNRLFSRKDTRALRRLLAREEIILYTSGHTHRRNAQDLTGALKLDRQTELREVTVPSLVDYIPAVRADGSGHQDARALALETMWVEGQKWTGATLKVAMEYKGLDPEDLGASVTDEVRAALDLYKREHGYSRARETMKQLRWKYLKMFAANWFSRLVGFGTEAFNPLHEKKLKEYWKEKSLLQNISNHLTVVSVIQMFNEAKHLVPLLRSLVWFTARDAEAAGDAAARAQMTGVMEAIRGITDRLERLYPERSNEFDAAFARGVQSAELRTFNDLFVESGVDQLAEILLDLPLDSQARSFAVLAGLESSREEYEFHRQKPTEVPNQLPTIAVNLSRGGTVVVG